MFNKYTTYDFIFIIVGTIYVKQIEMSSSYEYAISEQTIMVEQKMQWLNKAIS